jgi:branched-chain amino acid transport system ATP-binding protein
MSILVDDIHAYYGKSQAVRGVSLRVDPGESVCLLGRNGVGKSTTLKAIMGLVPIRQGRVMLGGRAITNLRPHEICRLGVGYVPEERRIFPTITVEENLRVAARSRPHSGKQPWRLDDLYRYFPVLLARRHQRAATLSGGEQQMLTMARSLMGNPDMLLIDEPTEGLAPKLVATIRTLIEAIQDRGISVLLVEQSVRLAMALGQRAYVMSKGQIVFEGGVDALRRNESLRREYLQV